MKIKNIAREVSERVEDPKRSGIARFIGLEHYDSGAIRITRFGSTESLDSSMKKFAAGDVLVARRNVYLKRAGFVDFDGLTSGDSIVLRPTNEKGAQLLPYILNSSDFWAFATQHADGSMSKRLSPKLLMEYEFNMPKDWELAAKRLHAINRSIEATQNLIVMSGQLIKARFIRLFGDANADSSLWPVGTIKDLVSDIHYGTSKPASPDGKYLYLRMNNITYDGELDLSDMKRITVSDSELPKCSVRKGDLLFNRTNSKELVGKTCVYDREEMMVLAGFIIRVRFNAKALPEYVSSFLNLPSSKNMLLSMCKAAIGQANINAQELQEIAIGIPPIEEQIKFVDFKKEVDASVAHLRAELKLLKSVLLKEITQQFK